MSGRFMTLTVGLLMAATGLPANAQERGTLEFGVFGNRSNYDNDLRMEPGWGGGGRVGAFIFPWLSAEVDLGERKSERPLGLQNVEVESYAARLIASPLTLGPLSLLLGGGRVHTDWQNAVTDGWQGLVGLKLGVGSAVALRLDGVMDWNHNDMRNKAIQLGLSFYRHPGSREASAPTVITRVDTVRAVRVDTVRAAQAVAPSPTGQTATICLATGEGVQVMVTAQNDTLVGSSRTSVRTLRQGGVGFAGEYAQGRTWFDQDQPISFQGGSFQKSGGEIRLDCPDIRLIGDYQGVPLFVRRDAAAPFRELYMPVRPGVWQSYENLRGTRG